MPLFLETKRLNIQTPSVNDFDHWAALLIEWNAERFTPERIQNELNEAITHFKKHGFSMGSVYEKDSKIFIGHAGLVYLDYNDAQPDIEVGYALHKSYWNKGYATELAEELIKWGFHHLPIKKLVAVTRPENKRSQRVLEKIGMSNTKIIQLHNDDFLFYEVYSSQAVR
ncbi:hypothetical protein C4K04_5436 [Pseudomonas chlororaphis]|uniref:N-acetyltransferase domain-containing protein n=1 Tax=Pseudomonas chlororaphis TaxID=587753 RepID=A0A3G7TVC8_9PSED|nr:GNAT family N-acetyltransferase [Pseudomonas chlororaphis]AZE51084.1 hypothetical protein C4K04_5436 [Pseudomonas chlororaphis]